MTTQNWLDIMPAIPLARGVPVIARHDTHPGRNFDAVCLHAHQGKWVVHDGGTNQGPMPEPMLRVDLADPQGFAYALRWLLSEEPFAFARALGWTPDKAETDAYDRRIVQALLSPTDDDRLALAKALAEVTL